MMLALTGEGIMGKARGPSRPCINPAPWVVAKRIKERRGGSPMRERPADFEEVFVLIGRYACQEHYRARRKAVTRWMEELGKARLIEARAAFVRERFMAERATRERLQRMQTPVSDFRFVHPDLVDAAVAWLRNNYPGGWKVCATGDGDWWIGLTRSSAAEVVDLAARYGFDAVAAVLTGEGEDGVGSGKL